MVVRNVWAVVALALIALVAGCSDDEGVVDGPAHADIDGDVPYGPGVVAGENYDYRLYTHCGIEWTRIDGVWWRATIPLDAGSGNPPSGWGNPYDEGELAVLDEATAVYRGGPSAEVEFERTDHVDAPFACD